MKIRIPLVVLFGLAAVFCFGQKQNYVWYFGHNAGLDFNSGTAVGVTSTIDVLEGSSSISDTSGALLFYSDGTTVWNKNQQVMPNGAGLLGGTSTSQVLIVPRPNSSTQYYIFHVQDHLVGSNKLFYTLVDMCLQGGLGDVVPTVKNVQINQPSTEKITAVMHANGKDCWVITHDLSSATFRSFLVTAAGVSSTPVTTTIGAFHASNQMIGCMQANHAGTKLALGVTFNGGYFQMFDFNKSTGVLSNAVNLISKYGLPTTEGWYDMEFSPNDNVLYVANTWNNGGIYQMDLTASSGNLKVSASVGSYTYAGIQLGPNGKIYCSYNNQQGLDVINFPNVVGAGCNFVHNALALPAGTYCKTGLPNFIPPIATMQIISYPQVSLGKDTAICGYLTLAPVVTPGATAYLWSTGATTASVTVLNPGTYWVDVTFFGCVSGKDTVVVSGGGVALATQSVSICAGDSILVNGHYYSAAGTYKDTLQSVFSCDSVLTTILSHKPLIASNQSVMLCVGDSILAYGHYYSAPGTYKDTIPAPGCDTLFTLTITNSSPLTAAQSVTVCAGDSLLVNGHYYSVPGIYKDTLAAPGCDTILTTTLSGYAPLASTQSVTICIGDSILVNGHYYSVPGTYKDTLTGVHGCDSVLTTHLATTTQANVSVTNSNPNVCLGFGSTLSATGTANYVWAPATGLSSTTGSTVIASPTANTTYTVIGSYSGGCADTVTVQVNISVTSFDPGERQICLGDTCQLAPGGNAVTFTWTPTYALSNPNISSPYASPSVTTTYTIMGTNANGCVGIDSQKVVVMPLPPAPTITANSSILTSSATYGNQWYFNGVLQAGDTSQTDTALVNGTYEVMFTDTFGCSSMSAPFIFSSAGVQEHVKNISVTISPNPSLGLFVINCKQEELLAVEVFDMTGQKVYSTDLRNGKNTLRIDLSTQADGVYFLKARTASGMASKKIVISR